MNMQAMMKQAQQMQKEMMKIKAEIDETEFLTENEVIKLKMLGNKEIVSYEIKLDDLEKADKEMIEDMTVVAFKETLAKIENEKEAKLGPYTKGMAGLI